MSVLDYRPGPVLSARYHVAGTTEQGPYGEAVTVESVGGFTAVFGPRTAQSAALYDDLAVYFAEGGVQAVVARAVSADPADCLAALGATSSAARAGCVAVPQHEAATIGAGLIAHAAAHDQIGLLAAGRDATAEDAAAAAGELAAVAGGDSAGLFHPWITARDDTGRVSPVTPLGYVAAARARAHTRVGFWQHPAGSPSASRRVVGLAAPATRKDAFEAGRHLVSGLAPHPQGVQLYGWWSLDGDRANFPHLTTRDLLNGTAAELEFRYRELGETPWGTVYRYTSQVASTTRAALATMACRGAFTRGGTHLDDDPGYRFTVTPRPEDGVVEVAIAVRPLQYARLVGINVIRVPLHLPADAATLRSLS